MNSEYIPEIQRFFKSIWDMLGSFTIPGTILTGQHLLVAPLGAVVLITVLKKVVDIGAVGFASGLNASGNSHAYSKKSNNKED